MRSERSERSPVPTRSFGAGEYAVEMNRLIQLQMEGSVG